MSRSLPPSGRRPGIVFVAQVPPTSNDSGSKRRNRQIIEALLESFEVRLLAFVRSDAERDRFVAMAASGLRVTPIRLRRARWLDLWHLLRSFVVRIPFLVSRNWTSSMAMAIRSAASDEETIAVHIDQISMACYLPVAKAAHRMVVIDEHDILSKLVSDVGRSYPRWSPQRLVARWDAARLRKFEAAVCAQADLVLAVNASDARELIDLGARNTRVVPIAMPLPHDAPPQAVAPTSTVLIMGTMYYPPNSIGTMWFLKRVLPELRLMGVTPEVLIVGARPPASLRSAAAENPEVRILGYVEDVDKVLRTSTMLAVPLLAGGGTRVKILEAFAHRLPVVATTPGYLGLDVVPGRELMVADDPRDFAAGIRALVTSRQLRRSLTDAGYEFVRTTHALELTAHAVRSAYAFLSSERLGEASTS